MTLSENDSKSYENELLPQRIEIEFVAQLWFTYSIAGKIFMM